ncbi:MAG TPA: hypothetical protein VF586_16700, partial [Pyrinomonadaceae bacterium]
CRACSRQVTEGDGVHRPVTPDVLKDLDYATTEVPDTEAQAAPAPAGEAEGEEPRTGGESVEAPEDGEG